MYAVLPPVQLFLLLGRTKDWIVDSLRAKAPYFGFPTPTNIYIYTFLRYIRQYGGQALMGWGGVGSELIVEMRTDL